MKIANKCLHIILIAFAFFALLSFPSFASGGSAELAGQSVEELLDDFSLILPDGMKELATDGGASRLGLDAILYEIFTAGKEGGGEAFSFFLLLMASATVMACASFYSSELSSAVRSALCLLLGGAMLFVLIPLVREVGEAFFELGEFFAALIPILTAAASLTGGGSVAAASGTGMSLSLSLFGGLCALLLPLVAVMLVLGVSSSIAPDMRSGIVPSVRNWFVRGIGILTACLGGLFALQSSVAAAGDNATLRAIKYAASGSIPVVGGAVSGAISTLAGGLGYAVGIIGGGGVAAMLAISLAPLVKLLLYRLAFFLASLFYESLSIGDGEKCFTSLAYGLDALIAVYSLGAVIYIFEAVVAMKSITSLL